MQSSSEAGIAAPFVEKPPGFSFASGLPSAFLPVTPILHVDFFCDDVRFGFNLKWPGYFNCRRKWSLYPLCLMTYLPPIHPSIQPQQYLDLAL